MAGTLVLIRHGQSDWNLKNLFTGWRDPDLSDTGLKEAHEAGTRLNLEGLHFDVAFTSVLRRAIHTCEIVLKQIEQPQLTTIKNQALNERDYGDLSGLNKDDARKKWGEEQVQIWRRSYEVPPPNGESLRDTGARVWPYYLHTIQPHVLRNHNVLVVAHGNSLRALIMALEGLSGAEIVKKEIATGVPIVYAIKSDSTIASKRVLDGTAAG